MLKTVEIRQTFSGTCCRAETLSKFSADDVRIQVSGEQVMILVDGHVTEYKDSKGF